VAPGALSVPPYVSESCGPAGVSQTSRPPRRSAWRSHRRSCSGRIRSSS